MLYREQLRHVSNEYQAGNLSGEDYKRQLVNILLSVDGRDEQFFTLLSEYLRKDWR